MEGVFKKVSLSLLQEFASSVSLDLISKKAWWNKVDPIWYKKNRHETLIYLSKTRELFDENFSIQTSLNWMWPKNFIRSSE